MEVIEVKTKGLHSFSGPLDTKYNAKF